MSNELVPYSIPELKQIIEENYLPEARYDVTPEGFRERKKIIDTLKAYLDLISITKPVETPEEEAQQKYDMTLKAVNHLEQELWIWEYKQSLKGFMSHQESIDSANKAVAALQKATPSYVMLPQGKEEW